MENPDIAPNAARCRFRRIVVKVGSNVLTRADGTLDTDRMAARRNIGRRGARALIHYDYLYLD